MSEGESDSLRSFVFEGHPLRGRWLRLTQSWADLREHQHLPAKLEALLGEAVTAAALLAATLKFRGTLTLQIAGNGLAKLLIAQCSDDFRLRAVLRRNEDADPAALEAADFHALIGEGQLIVTLETGEAGALRTTPYQGIVPLQGNSLAECLESYFATSEQLPTRLLLTCDHTHCAGVLLQKLPTGTLGEAEAGAAQEVWERASESLAGLDQHSLLGSSPADLLRLWLGGYDVRMYDAVPLRFECRCSPERVAQMLRLLGPDEVRAALSEQGSLTVTCEFCGRPYRFGAVDVERLFAGVSSDDRPPSRLN